jgi:hypothetical protein
MEHNKNFNDVYLMIIDKKNYSLYVIYNRVYNERKESLIYTLLNTFSGDTIEVSHQELNNEKLFERKVVEKFAIENYG